MSEKIKLQHYVPKCYLKNFSIQDREDFLFCFDKSKSSKFVVNSRNIASETSFYDTYEDIDQQTEKTLSYLESSFNFACRNLVEREDLSGLTTRNWVSMARFIAIQELRTKERRTNLKDMVKRIIEGMSKVKQSDEEVERLRLLTELVNTDEGVKSLHISILEDIKVLADDILHMGWVLLINRTLLPYWCSDHPVSHYHHIDMSPWGNLDLKCGAIQAYFPLSPKISLCLCDRIMGSSLPSKREVLDVRQIIFQNYLQVYGSTRYIFSNKDDFSLAEQMIKYKDGCLLVKPS